jgi:hypothetical protein
VIRGWGRGLRRASVVAPWVAAAAAAVGAAPPGLRLSPLHTHPPTHPPSPPPGGFVASWTGVIRFHGPRPIRGAGRVWVANHTSMIDYIILSSYSAFAVIMQLHGGWVGFLQTKVLDSLGCLWFNRTEVRRRGRARGRAGPGGAQQNGSG